MTYRDGQSYSFPYYRSLFQFCFVLFFHSMYLCKRVTPAVVILPHNLIIT